jgi:hypothetical protein
MMSFLVESPQNSSSASKGASKNGLMDDRGGVFENFWLLNKRKIYAMKIKP